MTESFIYQNRFYCKTCGEALIAELEAKGIRNRLDSFRYPQPNGNSFPIGDKCDKCQCDLEENRDSEFYSMVKPIEGSTSRLVILAKHRVKGTLCLEYDNQFLMDYPIRYHNGKIGYENPECHTEEVFNAVRQEFDRALEAGERYPNDHIEK